VDSFAQALIQHGSYVLLLIAFLVAAVGVPIPEELCLLAAGVLLHRGIVTPVAIGVVCLAGLIGSDVILFMLARRLGKAAYKRERLARFLEGHQERLAWIFSRHGGRIVFYGRLIPGLRSPVLAFAASHGMTFGQFIVYDLLALAVGTPLWFAAGYYFSDQLPAIAAAFGRAKYTLLAVLLAAVAAVAAALLVRRARGRRIETEHPVTW
jgi:membrane protein DedA with SNARE-associated domain